MTTQNPLHPINNASDDQTNSYLLQKNNTQRVEPSAAFVKSETEGRDAAANIIRQRIAELYTDEPEVKDELTEINNTKNLQSKHQIYLKNLQDTAKSVAEIQTGWHQYYTNLPEQEKHQVWQEFYAEQAKQSRYAEFVAKQPKIPETTTNPLQSSMRSGNAPERAVVSTHEIATSSAAQKRLRDMRSAREIKQAISYNASQQGILKAKHHFQSLLFGLSAGAIVIIVVMFGLFNELIIAPFIQPNRNVSATPIILTTDGIANTNESKIIIPKINVEIPIDYSLTSLTEADVQKGLESGVIHYPATVMPGEIGNGAYFGHSSNNIFNPGKYKFAFVLLSKLENGDMFYITYNGKAYAYKVFKKQVVNPGDTWVLGAVPDKPVTATLITCDPPGTTKHRLVVWGEQISPDAGTATASTNTSATIENTTSASELPGPAPSMWQRIKSWIF